MFQISKLFAASAAAALLSAAAPAAAELPDPDTLEAFVDGVVEPLMKNHASPSGVVAIAWRGEVVLAKGYGYEDLAQREPVDAARTLFRPGSVSKLFTWVAVMQQVEAGRLDLDTDVNEYLETFRIEDTFEQPITLRHILTHTAGFEDGALGYLIVEDPEKTFPLAEAMARYQPARVNPPGAQTAYSNYATALAGLIVQNVSGVPFNDYIRQNIFEPLGMRHASFEEPLPEALAERMANSYKLEAGRFSQEPFEIIASFGPAGGLSATGTDMLRFARAMLNGGSLDGASVLQPATAEEMFARQFTHDERMMGMGLGFYATDYNGHRVVGHGGDTQWFHSYLGIDEANDLALFVSFGGSGGSAVRNTVTPALYDEYFPRSEAPPEVPGEGAADVARYAGTYGFWRNNFSTIEKALRLAGAITVAPTERGTLVVAFGGKAKEYAKVDDNLFRETNPGVVLMEGFAPRLVSFQEDAGGAVSGMLIDGLPFMSLRKLPAWGTPNFNLALLGLSLLVFAAVLARRFYGRAVHRAMPAADRSAVNAAVWAAGLNWLVVGIGVVVLSIVMDDIFRGIPMLMKAWLVLPILATVAGLWLAWRTLGVWKGGHLAGFWARVRYTVVALCGLFMAWFYWYWNILGWQYMA